MFLLYCISGFLIAELLVSILKFLSLKTNLPLAVKLRSWAIAKLGGLPRDYINHFIRLGGFSYLTAFEQQLALIADKPDAEYRKYVEKFIELNLDFVNSEECNDDGFDIKFVTEKDFEADTK